MRRSTWLVALALSMNLLAVRSSWPQNPHADIVVYGAQEPKRFRFTDGSTFTSPYTAAEDENDPETRVVFETIEGMRNPLGSEQWGSTTFGKYVFSGTYQAYGGISASFIGVIDSESHEFFQLPIPNDAGVGATKRTLVTTKPTARKSRILLAGDGEYQESNAALAYLEADLDTPPATWPVTVVTSPMLGGGPGDFVDFDGVTLFRHEEDGSAFGVDFVILHAWTDKKILVARIDAAGVSTLASYPTTQMVLNVGPNGSPCHYNLRPVQLAAIDVDPSHSDERFVSSYDATSDDTQNSPLCPIKTLRVMQEFSIDLDGPPPLTLLPTSPLFIGAVPGGGGTPESSLGAGIQVILPSLDTLGHLWVGFVPPTNQGDGYPALFHRKPVCAACCVVDGVVRGNASAGDHCYHMPGAAPDSIAVVELDQVLEFDHGGGPIDSTNGALQIGGTMFLLGRHSIQRARLAYGTWVLEDDSSFKVSLHTPMLPAEARECRDFQQACGFGCVTTVHRPCDCPPGTDADDACPAEPECVGYPPPGTQRLCSPVLWACSKVPAQESSYRACVCPSDDDDSCEYYRSPNDRCPAGELCTRYDEDSHGAGQPVGGVITQWRWILSPGGSPPSLWTAERFRGLFAGHITPSNNLYMFRIPLSTAIPDGVTTARPAAVWVDGRLWLVTEHGGVLSYRTRDEGQWNTPWAAMPANPVVGSGGVALIATEQAVPHIEAFARGSDNAIYAATLANTDCTPGTTGTPGVCDWGAGWSALTIPGGITPVGEPSAAYLGFTSPIVVVRASNNAIYFTRRILGSWTAWTQIPGLTADSAPSVAWNPNDGTGAWWVVARESGTRRAMLARVIPSGFATTWSGWSEVGAGNSQAPWQSPPAIAYDGDPNAPGPGVIRVFASTQDFPNLIYQAVHDGSAWDAWRRLASEGKTLRQPSVPVVDGDVHLVSSWWNTMSEMLAK